MTDTVLDKQLPKILIVDDSLQTRQLLVHLLSSWGYPVAFSSGGQHAVELIRSEKVQLVLIDWHMPVMPGKELCVTLRGLDLGQYTYMILMAAQNDEVSLIEALEAGADDVLIKPVDAGELEARLQSAVRRIQLQAQLTSKADELSHAYNVIAQDLRAVSRLQRSFLPEPKSPFPQLNYQWLSVPSKHVSGDHLHVFELLPDVYGFYLLDVSGHGIPAAVKSMQLVQMFADHSDASLLFEGRLTASGQRVVSRPHDVVSRLNKLFQQTESDLSYFTMIYGIFNASSRHVSFCQAGHPSPLLLSAHKNVQVLGRGGYPVGLFDLNEFEEIELILGQKDALILYSDGVTEVLSDTCESFGQERLLELMNQQSKLGNWTDLPEQIRRRVQLWGGSLVQKNGFEDDVSILMLTPRPCLLDQRVLPDTNVRAAEPVVKRQETQQVPQWMSPSDTQTKSILIVDDSRSFLRIFQALLTGWGYQVYLAKNGHEALALIEQVQPHFVLTDWDMPGMSGIQLCQQVRAHKQNEYTYIIMITGYATRDELLYSLRAGADDFMIKPVNPAELKVRLKTAQRITNLHTGLARRHTELSQLYEALQRDMREVSRIQRALLPKSRPEPWPFALQTIYQPQNYVCGKQMGVLKTQANEQGFFMLSMRGDDTTTALQAMALARWFSMARATRVLFPIEETSARIRRYLAHPSQVWAQLSSISLSLNDQATEFDLLYGLLNLDQGTLLVAGIGNWRMVLAQPGMAPAFFGGSQANSNTSNIKQVLYQGIITPGSRLYFYSQECEQCLGLADLRVWSDRVLLPERHGNLLNREFSRLLSVGLSGSKPPEDAALLCMQWRECFDPTRFTLSSDQTQALIGEIQSIGLALHDEFRVHEHILKLGDYQGCLAFEAVADTANISFLGSAAREFVEKWAYIEDVCYNTDLVVSEALTNVMVYGFKDIQPEPVRLIIMAFQHVVAVVIQDHGLSIPADVLEKMRQANAFQDDLTLIELPEGGMGLAFMRLVSKRFVYQVTPNKNRLILLLS